MKGCVATIGMFDGVHLGHRFLLDRVRREAAARGLGTLVVTFGRHPLSVINAAMAPKRLTTNNQRAKLLSDSGVDRIVTLDFDDTTRLMTASQFMRHLRDDYDVREIVMGFNHRFGHDRLTSREQYAEAGRSVGVDVVFAEPYDGDGGDGVCSSAIRTALVRGDVASANRMLGRPYSLRGKVVGGKRLGRTIGYPTANISLGDDSLLVPARGVYAVSVTLDDGETKRGMLNIGVRPTVDDSETPETTLEVNIFDWDGSLYGREIEVSFLARLRDERRFDNIEQLKKQLDEDRRAALDV